ncbi:MAG TPA: DMT family transporter [Pyrinomonadaceae bacterium]|nr:DMT family transporter [Pyrinomonadaceae bacterium]
MKVFVLTTFALTAFAFNSILCRMALGAGEADAAGFTAVRLLSGALVLAVVLLLSGKTQNPAKNGNWPSAFFLFAYAIAFSFASFGLTAATGALILFGCVQITMIAAAVFRGERPAAGEWFGVLVAFSGLVYLVLPGLSAPPLTSALLMAAAGVAWGFYTLRGKGSTDPLADTAGNFIRSVPMIALAALPFISQLGLSFRGFVLAVLSGAVASGIGYWAWYAALRYHTATRASVLQLSVPAIAALGGIVFLAESAGLRLLASGALILGGIGLTILFKPKA